MRSRSLRTFDNFSYPKNLISDTFFLENMFMQHVIDSEHNHLNSLNSLEKLKRL